MEGPEAIRRSPTKVPRWVWAGAIATILLLCGIFIWRKPSNPQPPPTPSPFADLLIESEPSGADLTLDGGSPMKTPHTFKDLKFGPHRLTMTLEGYSPIERDLQFSGLNPAKIILEPKPKPREEIAKLSVRSDPPGASIRLDGTLPQEPPNTFTNVKFGEHKVTAALEGYEPKEQVLAVHGGISNEIVLKLDRAQTKPAQDPLQALITERNDYEAARDWPKYRNISLELVRRLTTAGEPASKEHRDLLANVIEGIRTKGHGLSSEEFGAYEANLKYAAKLDLVPAILVLADNLRQRKSPDAFNWYYYAAETKHVAPAMTKLGWLYWLGECGQEADKAQALKWFKLAQAAGETNAGVIVGKCYLRGDGIAKDEDEAIRILRPLAEAGVADAKTLIGECYYYGLGQFAKLTQKQRDQMAKKFFEEAVAAGDWEACGHLGVMYEVGQGVPKDWKQAARLYLQGVENENPVCMYYYARAIENHGVDLMKMLGRQDKAETYYAKAAAASITEARKWCIEHDVKF
jgi:TPR repeat protein